MTYKIQRVRYDDGTKAPWWKILIYKNGKLFDEYPQQYSSLYDAIKFWFIVSINSFLSI